MLRLLNIQTANNHSKQNGTNLWRATENFKQSFHSGNVGIHQTEKNVSQLPTTLLYLTGASCIFDYQRLAQKKSDWAEHQMPVTVAVTSDVAVYASFVPCRSRSPFFFSFLCGGWGRIFGSRKEGSDGKGLPTRTLCSFPPSTCKYSRLFRSKPNRKMAILQ